MKQERSMPTSTITSPNGVTGRISGSKGGDDLTLEIDGDDRVYEFKRHLTGWIRLEAADGTAVYLKYQAFPTQELDVICRSFGEVYSCTPEADRAFLNPRHF